MKSLRSGLRSGHAGAALGAGWPVSTLRTERLLVEPHVTEGCMNPTVLCTHIFYLCSPQPLNYIFFLLSSDITLKDMVAC